MMMEPKWMEKGRSIKGNSSRSVGHKGEKQEKYMEGPMGPTR